MARSLPEDLRGDTSPAAHFLPAQPAQICQDTPYLSRSQPPGCFLPPSDHSSVTRAASASLAQRINSDDAG
jgi:hypothetical protein